MSKVLSELSQLCFFNSIGMSFLNGIPFPDSSDPAFGLGVNEILRYEQNYIMGQVMSGEITDDKPKSVYAHLLKGDNIYPQYHELLSGGSDAEYAPMSTKANDLSLIIPRKNDAISIQDVDAFFVIEAVIDVDSLDGINMAKDFLDLIESAPEKWHETKNVLVGFRLVLEKEGIKGDPTKGAGLASLFCSASRLRPKVMRRAIEIMMENGSYLDATHKISKAKDIDKESRETLADITKYVSKCSNIGTTDKKNYYTVNGRIYSPVESAFGPFLTKDDVIMLINIELDKTVGMTRLIAPKLMPKDENTANKEKLMAMHNAITLSLTALNHVFSKSESSALSQFSQGASSGIVEIMENLEASDEQNPLYFSWNEVFAKKKLQVSLFFSVLCRFYRQNLFLNTLQVEVSVILDPLTEPTQRVAPLLLTIRDHLKIPLKLLIAPRQIIENRLPLSSYYRFVLDPSATPDTNPPAALFSNLPSNHLLTVRLDVPETFDVQQSFAIQDADNLRCDAKYGCGDKAYVLANGGEVTESLRSPNDIELTQIEYTLKSLLFFGQCYDASTSSPPNGLQLTLDRYRLPGQQSMNEIQINPDGTTSDLVVRDEAKMSIEHTDTLVMKTVGYWQLRANPGVWDLKIAENSRGAEIYHMVDGSLSPFGRLIVDMDAASFMSKSMVMKDFTDHRQLLVVKRNEGHEMSNLYLDESELESTTNDGNETVHVFSLATGHAYERLLKIMMLSVTKRTKSPVKFWFFENVSELFQSIYQCMA